MPRAVYAQQAAKTMQRLFYWGRNGETSWNYEKRSGFRADNLEKRKGTAKGKSSGANFAEVYYIRIEVDLIVRERL